MPERGQFLAPDLGQHIVNPRVRKLAQVVRHEHHAMGRVSPQRRRSWELSQEPGRLKTFRFGVNVGPSRSRAEWVAKARKLEGLGYTTLTVPDHLADFLRRCQR
jgi:hypothetical protein